MNQLLLWPTDLSSVDCCSSNRYLLQAGDDRLRHLISVLRVQTGTVLRACMPNQKSFQVVVLELGSDFCLLEEGEEIPIYQPWCHLVVGISRPPTMRKIIEHGTCLGVDSFDFVLTSLGEKSYLQSGIWQEKTFLSHIYNGLSQSAYYGFIPQLRVHQSFSFFLQHTLRELQAMSSSCFLLEKTDGGGFLNFISQAHYFHKPLLLIGPERGFTENEKKAFLGTGAQPVCVSATTLRVELAVFAALSQLEMCRQAEDSR